MNSLNDLWASVLSILATRLTSTTIRTWFEDCVPVELEDGRLVLQAPIEFKRNMIVQRYADYVKDALRELFSCEFELLVLVGDELDDYLRREREVNALPEMDGYTFDNFIVGNSNKFAHAAALGVVSEPGRMYNPLFIYGNSGLGKTHLLLAIGSAIHAKSPADKIVYVKGDEFLNDIVTSIKEGKMEEFRQKYRFADLFLVDDIQFIAGKERSQEEFFHTFNSIYEAGHQIVLTSDRPPMDMALLDDRLRTRFEGGLLADVQPPDSETRMAIIRDKAGHRGMALSDEVVTYIAEKITSNVRQIEGVVNKLTAYRDLVGDTITRDTVDRAIADVVKDGEYVPSVDDIIEETARFYQVSPEDIRGQKRTKNIAMARHMSMYLIRTLIAPSLKDIGGYFGDKDHATVLSSIKKIESLIKTDKDVSATVRDITSNLNARQR